jgi:hypothetical protein
MMNSVSPGFTRPVEPRQFLDRRGIFLQAAHLFPEPVVLSAGGRKRRFGCGVVSPRLDHREYPALTDQRVEREHEGEEQQEEEDGAARLAGRASPPVGRFRGRSWIAWVHRG